MRYNQLMMSEIAMKVMVNRFDNRHRIGVVSSMCKLECGKQVLLDIVKEVNGNMSHLRYTPVGSLYGQALQLEKYDCRRLTRVCNMNPQLHSTLVQG